MNCLIIEGDKQSSRSLEKIITKSPHLKLVASCNTERQAIEAFQKERIDVVFIGNVEERNEIMRYVKERKPHVIRISSVTEANKMKFDYKLSDELFKPVSRVQVNRVINKIISDEAGEQTADKESYIFIKLNRAFLKIPTESINYIQAFSDYVKVHTAGKVYTTHATMKDMHLKLPAKDFVRVHRSYIVRIDKIIQMQDGFISVEKRLIPIGKLYKDDLMERVNFLK